MRFKIYSTIFIFIACFLLFSYTPIQGEIEEELIFLGDTLSDEQQQSFKSKIAELNGFYQNQKFKKIGKFYKETGKLTAYDLQAVQGRHKIATYFKRLYELGKVKNLKFIAKSVYAQKLEPEPTLNKLLEAGIIQKKDIPDGVVHTRTVTHSLHAIISVEFTLPNGKKYNQGRGSRWDGWHIQGCPIF